MPRDYDRQVSARAALVRRLGVAACWLLGVAACCLTLLGCRGSSEPPLVPVAGRVLVGDKPVRAGMVQFRADSQRGNRSLEIPTGTLLPDGSFTLATRGKPGAPPGWYRVLVLADNFTTGDPPPSPEWPKMPRNHPRPLVHERYLYFEQTDVIVEVVPAPRENAYVLRLK